MTIRSIFTILFISIFVAGCVSFGSQKPAPITKYGQSSGVGSAGAHNVVSGDSLYSISQAYRLPMRDIVILNKLQAPFKLQDGMRIKLPPPHEYIVRDGDTIYDVSRLFGVNSNEIVRLNKLKSPYSVHSGQILRLPTITRKTQIASIDKTVMKNQIKSKNGKNLIEREILTSPEVISKNSYNDTLKYNEELISKNYLNHQKKQSLTASPLQEPQNLMAKNVILTTTAKTNRLTAKVPSRESSKFMRPVKGDVISDFGPKNSGLHNDGINIKAEKGASVYAAENGLVVYAGNELKGSGNLVLLRHEDQWVTAYAHMDQVKVTKGDVLKRGEVLGYVGMTGSVNTPQLHFEIRRGTDAINPKNYLE